MKVDDVENVLPLGLFMTSLDLVCCLVARSCSSAFQRVPGVLFEQQMYHFRGLSFGLNSTQDFYQTNQAYFETSEAIGFFSSRLPRRLAGLGFLGTGMCQGNTKSSRSFSVQGVLIIFKKSRLYPRQDFEWLGIAWNPRSTSISLTVEKRKSLKVLFRKF